METGLPAGLPPGVAERGEAALADKRTPVEPPPPAGTAAVELPLAEGPTLSRPHTHAPSSSHPKSSSSHASACGGVEARLITASEDPAWAFASLSPSSDEPAVIRRVGERIGNWQVDKIEWDRVWLRGGAGRCAVGMHFGAREEMEAQEKNGKRRSSSKELALLDDAVPDAKKPWRVPGEIANSIDKLSETEFAVERAMVTPLFERSGALFYGLSIEPAKKDDKVIGLTLGEVKTDSLLERLGLETGDIVLSIDGESIDSLDSVIKALSSAREHERLIAKLERKGEPFELRVVAR